MLTVHIIGNAHIDPVWLWRWPPLCIVWTRGMEMHERAVKAFAALVGTLE